MFLPLLDGDVDGAKETAGQSVVYTVGVPPQNYPALAAKLRDGNHFNSCIEASEKDEIGIEFKEAYLLERMVITTVGRLFHLVLTYRICMKLRRFFIFSWLK